MLHGVHSSALQRGGTALTNTMLAYIGPGGVLSAIGSFLALLAAVVLALFGFVWYPIKRMMRARRERRDVGGDASSSAGS